MTDNELEQRLQAFYRAELPADLTAPAALRSRVATIPEASPLSRRPARHRGVTLLAAAALLATTIIGGALLAGGGIDPNPSLRDVVAPSSTPSSSELAGPSAGPTASPVTNPAGVWIATGRMGTPRAGHAAVRLLDGRVLVTGGSGPDNETSAELYDPETETWSATGNMATPLFPDGTATLLRDGKVLVRVWDGEEGGAEVYDPESGTWTATGKMVVGVEFGRPTATSLRDGKVLVAGFRGAQLYDPANGTWTATGKMTRKLYWHTATLLPDGRVLAVGDGMMDPVYDPPVNLAELFDPATGTWTATADMHARYEAGHTATLLRDGKVLVAGLNDDDRRFEVEIYDPATGTWTVGGDRTGPGSGYATATLLSDGTVLMAGGMYWWQAAEPPTAAELYDPRTGSWTTTGSMLQPHDGSSFTLLLDGRVLVAGGADCSEILIEDRCSPIAGSAELYIPGSGQ